MQKETIAEEKQTIAEEKQTNKTKPEMVTVPKEELASLLRRLERVESASDKSRLAKIDSLTGEEKSKVIRLRTYDGKVITGWKEMLSNVVEKNGNGLWREEQVIEIEFEDGTTQELPLVLFVRRYKHIEATVQSETKLNKASEVAKNGDVIFNVITEEGKEYSIGSLFIN